MTKERGFTWAGVSNSYSMGILFAIPLCTCGRTNTSEKPSWQYWKFPPKEKWCLFIKSRQFHWSFTGRTNCFWQFFSNTCVCFSTLQIFFPPPPQNIFLTAMYFSSYTCDRDNWQHCSKCSIPFHPKLVLQCKESCVIVFRGCLWSSLFNKCSIVQFSCHCGHKQVSAEQHF